MVGEPNSSHPKIRFVGKKVSSTMKCAVFLPGYLFQAKQNSPLEIIVYEKVMHFPTGSSTMGNLMGIWVDFPPEGKSIHDWLVVWNMTFMFPNSWDDDPIDFHIFQRG